MTQEQLLLELFDGLIRLQGQTNDILVAIKGLNERTILDNFLPHIFSFVSILIAAAALFFTHRENKKSEQLPYLKMLHDELNDIILTVYDILNNPTWEAWSQETKDRVGENFSRIHSNFLAGNRFFVISSIPTDQQQIFNSVKNSGRRVMYFDLLKNRYVEVFEALDKATKQFGDRQPLYAYFKMAEYERIYIGFKKMPDIKTI